MSIEKFFIHPITVKRLTNHNNKQTFMTSTYTKGHRQAIQQGDVGVGDGSTTKTYKIWCSADDDIIRGDRLTIKGLNYEVTSIEKKDYGTNQHLEVICELIDEGSQ